MTTMKLAAGHTDGYVCLLAKKDGSNMAFINADIVLELLDALPRGIGSDAYVALQRKIIDAENKVLALKTGAAS